MKWVVEKSTTLKDFLESVLLEEMKSKKAIKKLLDQGHVSVNRKVERFGKVALKKGDQVVLATKEAKSEKQTFEPDRILFEDSALLIYDKPCGIISDGVEFMEATSSYYPHLIPIHRLDKETSGILMFAKSKEVLDAMVELFQKEEVKKTYAAIVSGTLSKKRGSINEPIDVVYREGTAKRFGVKQGGKPALTHFELVESKGDHSLLYLFPVTGRTHQLRVHLNFIGHPILGDQVYGREWGKRMFLHAMQIAFPHPETTEMVKIVSPLPEEFHFPA
jgi:RluA family pseudouridine synthase